MRLRSLLFAPGDRPERFEKALASGADAVILDLEDSVAPLNKPKAREKVHEFVLHHAGETNLLIRINPLASPEFEDDLTALSGLHPFAIVLPKAEGAASVLKLAGSLASAIPILPIATETPSAIFEIGSYRDVSTSLCGLTWGAEDLPAAMGATTARRTDGRYTPPFELARSLTLFGAHAAAVPAIDTVYPDFRDLNGLRSYVGRARRDGFSGMMAIHPSQVEVINHAFTPDASEIAWAEKVAAAFAARPDAGVVQLDGRMLDLPHLKLALRLLNAAGR
ncbi:HpcH/HpaI aldolase/citrate lyase family protein [Rhizobium leguminosarum]|uniref:HpcH/HpaI aldolase/citrate lyase family protein n=1 Tax=Rhizobium leguminosarum TaxID=384 RepID=UPI0012F75677|nr:CoA ester lyase [Rhizobium leguminosarum]MVO92852.1 CoA ester lyase [Rhizobium leguminosarum bv. phaseoli]